MTPGRKLHKKSRKKRWKEPPKPRNRVHVLDSLPVRAVEGRPGRVVGVVCMATHLLPCRAKDLSRNVDQSRLQNSRDTIPKVGTLSPECYDCYDAGPALLHVRRNGDIPGVVVNLARQSLSKVSLPIAQYHARLDN